MLSETHILQRDECPCSSIFLGSLYRASPSGLQELIVTIPVNTRALLALYCYRRAHLQSIGLSIAATCDEFDLESSGGAAGLALFERAKQAPKQEPLPTVYSHRKQVTLSTAVLKEFARDEHDEVAVPVSLTL